MTELEEDLMKRYKAMYTRCGLEYEDEEEEETEEAIDFGDLNIYDSKPELFGKGVKFERIRRITGYVSTVDHWNNGKKAELKDRVKHG